METLPPPSGVSPKTVEKAVDALLKWRSSKLNTQKAQLLEHDEFVYLILTLKKIPQKGFSRTNAHKIPIPNPLMNPLNEAPEICLIIDDRPKSGLNKDAAKKKIQNDNIPISKIIKISKLKTDYRPFEAKRKLCDSYDMFFADRRVVHLLPKMLGKQFFKKKKIPVPLDLKHHNWKEQIDKAFGSALLYLRSGTCSVVKVGRISMSREEIAKNVMAAINGISEIVPRKWGGIRSFHLKLLDSLALPVYQSVPDLKLKIDDGAKEEENEEEDGVVAQKEEKEKVKKGKIGKKKGRIHEVRYMDNNNNDNVDGQVVEKDELGSDGEGYLDNDDDDDDFEKGSGELLNKKRKKGANKEKGEKKEKKVAKLKKEDGVKRKKATNEDGFEQKKLKKGSSGLEIGGMEVKDKKKKKRLAT
ncbi:unnamed protein product [Dovyalis caffra]|uniref:Ribosomal protein L1 n=1 Tax=Dovyalis caffra TaxID=77055 RepID=A0AAV1RU08_9ROSI|nr:unnamed protein product [Dovyalis caffra]